MMPRGYGRHVFLVFRILYAAGLILITITLDERGIDDAKKGEGKKVTPSREAGGSKDVVVYQDKPKRAVPKLLAASTSAAADAASLNVDAKLASTLEAMKSFLMADEGVMEIPQVKPIQAVPSEAAVPAAPLKALTEPPAKTQAKVMPPKTVPAKTSSKRPAPASKDADPAAKCLKIQASLAAKTSRLAEKKKEEEEEKRKEAERREAVKQARMKKVEERATKLLNENMLIQASLMRRGYIPFTPDESEVCYLAADIEACSKTIKEMMESNRYTKEEQDFIRKFISEKASIFNSEQSDRLEYMPREVHQGLLLLESSSLPRLCFQARCTEQLHGAML